MERLSPYAYPGLKFEGMSDKQKFFLKRTGRKPVDEYIMERVSEHFGVSVEDIKRRTRVRRITHARHIYFYLCRKFTQLTLDEIGKPCAGLDHTSLIHGNNKIKDLIRVDSEVSADVHKLSNQVKLFVDHS